MFYIAHCYTRKRLNPLNIIVNNVDIITVNNMTFPCRQHHLMRISIMHKYTNESSTLTILSLKNPLHLITIQDSASPVVPLNIAHYAHFDISLNSKTFILAILAINEGISRNCYQLQSLYRIKALKALMFFFRSSSECIKTWGYNSIFTLLSSWIADTDQMESGNQLLFYFWNRPLKKCCCI